MAMTKDKKRIHTILTVLTAFLMFGGVIIFRNLVPLLIAIPISIYLHKNKPKDSKDQEDLERAEAMTFALTALMPLVIILTLGIYFIFVK